MFADPLFESERLEFYSADTSTKLALHFVEGGIAAGFPSPAEDYVDLALDLNKELIRNPSSTFYGRVRGSSMKDAGILDGDVLVSPETSKKLELTILVSLFRYVLFLPKCLPK